MLRKRQQLSHSGHRDVHERIGPPHLNSGEANHTVIIDPAGRLEKESRAYAKNPPAWN